MRSYQISLVSFMVFITTIMPAYANTARIALVIGNGAYPEVGSHSLFAPLANSRHDADDMATILRTYGFQVDVVKDADQQRMENVVNAFIHRLQTDGVGLFYFSGHGVQVENLNYLIPVGRQFRDAYDIKYHAINANWVLEKMLAAQSQVSIMILDACRQNLALEERKGLTGNGFAKMEAVGAIISYATMPGSAAFGNSKERNSIYTFHLLDAMQQSSLPIERVFKNARAAVAKATNYQQIPWTGDGLIGDFCFGECAAPPQRPEVAPPSPPLMPSPEPTSLPKRPAVPPSKDKWIEPMTGMTFVWIPGGTFRMGCVSGVDCYSTEKPVHAVSVDGFWMATTEATNQQYRRWQSDHDSGEYKGKSLNGDSQPVVRVSWKEAAAFAEWLTQQYEGKYVFRLPTEAEWEYAARAGTTTARFWGNSPDKACQFANVHDQTSKRLLAELTWTPHNCNDGYSVTALVGKFRPNAFGLYDMLGNVWEWCQDVYSKNAYSAHQSSHPIYTGEGTARVLRGGSWFSFPRDVRCESRFNLAPEERDYSTGFRLVMTNLE